VNHSSKIMGETSAATVRNSTTVQKNACVMKALDAAGGSGRAWRALIVSSIDAATDDS
jgi:hypothetical protein